jgi:hypothetical protein
MAAIDFYTIGTFHIRWERNLKGFLEGKKDLPDSEIITQQNCDLENWLRSEGLIKYRNMPEVKQVYKIHTDFHNIFDQTVQLNKLGNKNLAEQEFSKLNPILKELVALLSYLGARIG